MRYYKTWTLGPRKQIAWTASTHVDGAGYYSLQYLIGYKLFRWRFRMWTTVCSVPEYNYKTDHEGIKALLLKHKYRKSGIYMIDLKLSKADNDFMELQAYLLEEMSRDLCVPKEFLINTNNGPIK